MPPDEQQRPGDHRHGGTGHHADSAGTPWEGRSFAPAEPSTDDGSAPPALLDIIARFHAGRATAGDVVDVVRESRLLIPLVAELAEAAVGATGLAADKSADLSIVTVAGPDGRNVMPVFSSAESMRAWKPLARPVPADAARVGIAAASDRTDLVVLDPKSPTEFAIRRPAVWALAQRLPWTPSHLDTEVAVEFARSGEPEGHVRGITVASGDPGARLVGPELIVTIEIAAGLDERGLAELIGRMHERWASSDVIASRVDSVAVRAIRAE